MSDKVKQLNVQVAATEKVLRAVNESVATKIAATISVLKESPDVSQLTTKIHSMQVVLTETAKNYEALKTAVGTEQIRATSPAFAATGSVPGHSGTHSPMQTEQGFPALQDHLYLPFRVSLRRVTTLHLSRSDTGVVPFLEGGLPEQDHQSGRASDNGRSFVVASLGSQTSSDARSGRSEAVVMYAEESTSSQGYCGAYSE